MTHHDELRLQDGDHHPEERHRPDEHRPHDADTRRPHRPGEVPMMCHLHEEGVQMTYRPDGRPRGGGTRIPGRHPLRPHEGGTTTTLPHEGDETIRPREGGRAGTSRA